MRVMLTGATGFVGSHVAVALTAAGHDVRVLVRDPARLRGGGRPTGLADLDHVTGDVADRAAVARAVRGCDAVVHAAGIMTFDRRRLAEARGVNVDGTATVLRAALDAGADPVVYVSSISALWPPSGPVLGTDEPVKQPASVYGGTKAGAERVARSLQESGAPVVIAYPGGVYGPGDPNDGEPTRGLRWVLMLRAVPASAGGFPTVDARDLGAALARVCEPGRGPRRYMLGGRLLDAGAVARALTDVTGRRIVVLPLPAWVLRAAGWAGQAVNRWAARPVPFTVEGMDTILRGVPFDNSAAERELGFTMRDERETFCDAIGSMCREGRLSPRLAGRAAQH